MSANWTAIVGGAVFGIAFGIFTIEAWDVEDFEQRLTVVWAWTFLMMATYGGTRA